MQEDGEGLEDIRFRSLAARVEVIVSYIVAEPEPKPEPEPYLDEAPAPKHDLLEVIFCPTNLLF
jgi:hypothetical protein